MAAPMKTCLLNFRKCCFSWTMTRFYARKTNRSVQEVMSPEEDVKKLRKPISDPRKNPYLPYNQDDPVQKSLKLAATRAKDNVIHHRKKSQKEKESEADRSYAKDYLKKQSPLGKHLSSQEKSSHGKSVGSHDRRDKQRQSESQLIKFEKLEETDKRFGRLIMQARSKQDRNEVKEIVLEGKNLIHDALVAGAKLKILYFTRLETLEELPITLLGDAQIYKVQYKHLKLWSDVETPQGVLGIFKMPREGRALRPADNPIPLTLVCDNIRDGGNLGTLIRTAAAVGCQRFIALKGCVDIWNGKALRSAAGSHFRVPIFSNTTWPRVPALLPPADSIKVFLADSKQVTSTQRQSVAIEAETLDAVNQIEQLKDIESDIEDEASDIDKSEEDIDAENELKSELKKNDEVEEDLSYKSFKVLTAYRKAPLSNELYDQLDYTDKHTVLVISGETSGVSLPARKLAYDHYGSCVTIPMEGEVESLNCAVAGSIIMYEVARQHRNVKVISEAKDEATN